jgi:tripartite-type tricarboxylate transporter receptor subunit TctC
MIRPASTLALMMLACVGFCALPNVGRAQTYPTAPIRLIVPYGPGAGVDVAARVVAEALSAQMKANVYVENRDGAGGLIGTMMAAQAAPDGYTLLFASMPVTMTQLLQTTKTYDPVKDFRAVSRVLTNTDVLVANPSAPYKTFDELIAYIKANPGAVSYATSGKGTPSHLEVELIRQHYGLEMSDVPYKTFGSALTDTIANRVGFFLSAYAALIPSIKAGQVRALVIGSPQRSEDLPDVPTLAEAMSVPNYHADVWYGIMAPAKTPDAVVAILASQIALAMQMPHTIERVKGIGAQVSLAPAAEFADQVRADTERWTRVVKSIGLDALQ